MPCSGLIAITRIHSAPALPPTASVGAQATSISNLSSDWTDGRGEKRTGQTRTAPTKWREQAQCARENAPCSTCGMLKCCNAASWNIQITPSKFKVGRCSAPQHAVFRAEVRYVLGATLPKAGVTRSSAHVLSCGQKLRVISASKPRSQLKLLR